MGEKEKSSFKKSQIVIKLDFTELAKRADPYLRGLRVKYVFWEKKLGALTQRQVILITFALGIAALIAGLFIGIFIAFPYRSTPTSSLNLPPTPPPSNGGELESRTGIVRRLESSVYQQGDYFLETEEPEKLLILASKRIDFSLFIGQLITVEGKITPTVEGDAEVMEVDKVKLK